jgi:hypothetical protein
MAQAGGIVHFEDIPGSAREREILEGMNIKIGGKQGIFNALGGY